MRQVDDEGVGQNQEFETLGVEFHRVRDFVPAESEKSLVVAAHRRANNDVRFKVRLPLDLCKMITKTQTHADKQQRRTKRELLKTHSHRQRCIALPCAQVLSCLLLYSHSPSVIKKQKI